MDELGDQVVNRQVQTDLCQIEITSPVRFKTGKAVSKKAEIEDFISLKDKSAQLGYTYLNDEPGDYDLPVDNTWIGAFPFWDRPWWERYDSTTFDNTGKDKEEQLAVIE